MGWRWRKVFMVIKGQHEGVLLVKEMFCILAVNVSILGVILYYSLQDVIIRKNWVKGT